MLYEWYEAQRALLSPFSEFAGASSKLYNHPLSLFAHTPLAHRVSAGLELMHRLAKDYEKPEFNIRSVQVEGVEVAVHEQVAIEKQFCRLLRFKRFSDDLPTLQRIKAQPTVLIVAPLSGHHSTLLRETVREMLKDHKVYITDWTDARMVPIKKGPFHLDDYVAYVQEFVRHIGPEVNVISVCQPTVPVLAAISLMATNGEPTPRTMTMMGGPIDARKSPTSVNNLATNKSHAWFENNVIFHVPINYPGAGRAVYPGFLQHAGFIAMNPDRHMKSHYDYFLDLIRGDGEKSEFHRDFYDEYNAVLDMPAEYYLDTIKTVFQDFALVNGTWRIKGELVRPQDIRTTALLTIEGELDDISGAGQTHAAHDICTGVPTSRQFHYDALGAGHYGIFSGRRWREKVYPRIRDFIASYQDKVSVKPAKRPTLRMLGTSDNGVGPTAGKRIAARATAAAKKHSSKAAARRRTVA
ncbi:MAG: polyhydroxyalkanoate depolymerase [Caldimonas sp.]